MTSPNEQKEMIKEIFHALRAAGRVKTRKDFLDPIGISQQFGSAIFKEGNEVNLPAAKVYLLLNTWNINKEWWDSKKGEMFSPAESNSNVAYNMTEVIQNSPNKPDIVNPDLLKIVSDGGRRDDRLRQIERNLIAIPIVEKRAQAGYALDYADPEYIEHLPKIYVSKEFERGNYVAFEVSGDSMDDDKRHAICDGDVVLTKELSKDLWRDKLHFGKYLFVIVYDAGCVIKQITHHDPDTGDITCHPFNPFFEDFTINLKDVYQLLYVVKVVDRTVRI